MMTDKVLIDRSLLQQALDAWQTSSYGQPRHHKAMLLAMSAIGEALAAPQTADVPEVGFGNMPKIGCVNHDCDKCQDTLQSGGNTPDWPTNAEQMRRFVGSNFNSLAYARRNQTPDENDVYTMSAHDLLSAIADWQDFVLEQEPQPAEPVSMSKKSQTEHELEAMNRYIQKITKDKSSATAFLSRAGILDPNGELAAQYRDVEYKMRADRSEQPAQQPADPVAQPLATDYRQLIREDFERRMKAAGHSPTALSRLDSGIYFSPTVGAEWDAEKRKYAQPQRQPLTPLTDEQIDAITKAQWGDMWGHPLAAHRAYARAIEKAHGITGEDK